MSEEAAGICGSAPACPPCASTSHLHPGLHCMVETIAGGPRRSAGGKDGVPVNSAAPCQDCFSGLSTVSEVCTVTVSQHRDSVHRGKAVLPEQYKAKVKFLNTHANSNIGKKNP